MTALSTTEAPVNFQVPAGFTPVDLTVSPAGRAAAVRAGLPAVPGVDDVVARHEVFAQGLLASRACYGAVFMLPPRRPAYFAITEPDGAPADLAALAARLPGDVRPVELPCGPALTCTEHVRLPGEPALVQQHAFVDHPAGRVVVFTLGVQDGERRAADAHLFAEILSTVSFTA